MKKFLIYLILWFMIAVGVIVAPVLMYKSIVNRPLNSESETVVINATSGTFSGVIAENEESFRGRIFIKIYNKLNKISISVKKGTYEFPSNIKLNELISSLENGSYNTSIVKVTIPEGYTLEQIATLLEEKEIVNKDNFITACENYNFPDYIKVNSNKRYTLEGYLFPDTYIFEKNTSPDTIIKTMLSRFEEIVSQIESENDIKVSYSDYERMVIKASIIEREVSKNDEKPLVSSVIENRLKINMKLQIDATVLYAIGYHKDKLYLKDLKYASPYNTYYKEGLPVGPISNPGKDSLVAALLPIESDYLYYMTKDGVNHKFFKTYKDFLKYKNS